MMQSGGWKVIRHGTRHTPGRGGDPASRADQRGVQRRGMTCWLLALLLAAAWPLSPATSRAETRKIVYADRLGIQKDASFPYAVLKLALQKSGVDHALTPSRAPMNDERVRASLDNGTIDVAWFGTSAAFEARFLPVRIPITRGVLGYRLFVIHEDSQPAFSKVLSLADLKRFVCIQGKGWADTQILAAAGIDVRTSAVFDRLFERIFHKRADFFPLGANEIFGLLKTRREKMPALRVEKNLVLVYPFDFFFFVKKGNLRLHDIISSGFAAAQEDGSYLQLFQAHPDLKDFLEKANIETRQMIKIENPLLTEETRKAFKAMSPLSEQGQVP
jgi:hypothetical protein